jgi:hypothetical protein
MMVWVLQRHKENVEAGFKSTKSGLGEWSVEMRPYVSDNDYKYYLILKKINDVVKKIGYGSFNIQFQLEPQSNCCAFSQLNGFSYHPGLTEEEIHQALDDVFTTLRYQYHNYSKILLNMVEYQKYLDKRMRGRTAEDSYPVKEDLHTGDFLYPSIYTWCKKQDGLVDIPIINQNTSRIIHHMIVMPTVCQN